MILKDRVAVVTGGGRGIGAAVAQGLAAAGAQVGVVARGSRGVEEVVEAIREGGGAGSGFLCDVTDPEAVAALPDAVRRELGPVDILVNNAGASASAPLERITLQEWNRLLAVNATATLLCMQAFLPGMVERGWGRVVNVASVAGLTGARYIGAYAASKHAQVGLTRAAAAEMASRGVTVNAVCPGYVDTEMTEGAVQRIMEKTGRSPEEALQALLSQSPQSRLIRPQEVAHLVVSLCAPDAEGVNGEAIVLDGGALLR